TLLMLGLLTMRHEIIRNTFAIKPAIPGFTGRGDNSSAPQDNNVYLLHGVWIGYRLWEPQGLTLIALKDSCSFHGTNLSKKIRMVYPNASGHHGICQWYIPGGT